MGGPGVQRNLKFTKYLPKSGWQPVVLTAKELFFPVYDYGLLEEIPAEATIIRTETLDPTRFIYLLKQLRSKGSEFTASNALKKGQVQIEESSIFYKLYRQLRRWLLIPDNGILWLPFAVWRGYRVIKEQKIDVILGSSPGPSSAIITYMLSKLTGVPYVLDFRDGWLDYPYNDYPTKVHRCLNAWLERTTVMNAAKIVTFGEFLTNRLKVRYSLSSDRFTEISNGFDPADFEGLEPYPHTDQRKHIVHSGNVMDYRLPVFRKIVEAVASLPASMRRDIVLDFVGYVHPEAQSYVASKGLSDTFRFWGYMSHKDSLKLLQSADATLIMLPPDDLAAVTGKIFEYIAVGKPIISVSARQGGCGKLVASLGDSCVVANPDDSRDIATAFEKIHSQYYKPIALISKQKYSRAYHTTIMANLLAEVAEKGKASVFV
jgi:glycosyltransferase involved in cell wall biosynthesis